MCTIDALIVSCDSILKMFFKYLSLVQFALCTGMKTAVLVLKRMMEKFKEEVHLLVLMCDFGHMVGNGKLEVNPAVDHLPKCTTIHWPQHVLPGAKQPSQYCLLFFPVSL